MQFANITVNIPQISRFQVYLTNNQTINEPIENINQLSEIIRIYGRGIIVKIVFNFYDNNNNNNHNIILQNSFNHNDRFIVEFFHTDLYNQLCEYTAITNCINNDNQTLYNLLGKFIINPFNNNEN
jgi:hypothetical protein